MKTPPTLYIKHIPFVHLSRKGLDAWKHNKVGHLIEGCIEFREVPTTYISVSDLKEKARTLVGFDTWCAPLIWNGTIGLMSRSWVNKYRGREYHDYQFSTGAYEDSSSFLLVDDLHEWAQRRIETKDIRSAFDIIIAIRQGKITV